MGVGRGRGSAGRDDRLAARALREGWDVPAARRAELVGRLMAIATDPGPKPREAVSAARAVLETSRISLESVRVAVYATRPPAAGPVAISVTGPALSPELAAAICAVTGGGESGPVPPRPGLPSAAPADPDLEDWPGSDPEPPPPIELTDGQQCAILELLCDEDDPFPGPDTGDYGGPV